MMTTFPLSEIFQFTRSDVILSIFFKHGEKLCSKSKVSELTLEKCMPRMWIESRHSRLKATEEFNSMSPMLRPYVLERLRDKPEYSLKESIDLSAVNSDCSFSIKRVESSANC